MSVTITFRNNAIVARDFRALRETQSLMECALPNEIPTIDIDNFPRIQRWQAERVHYAEKEKGGKKVINNERGEVRWEEMDFLSREE